MGAHSFEDYGPGKTPGEAYDELKSQAEYEYGHSPYSGTIATTSGFVVVDVPERKLFELAMAEDASEKYNVGKWDNCLCCKADNQPGPDPLWYFCGWAAC